MFKAERQEKIKALVTEQKQVDVSSLSKLLNVTEVTIRSDLEQLEREGFLKRLHGGAILNREQADQREGGNLPGSPDIAYNRAKEVAAKAAAGLVEEKDRIFLGAGETCYYIAKELVRFKQLTVLTNNLYVAGVLGSCTTISLTLTGGQVVPGRHCLAGEIFQKTMESLYPNKAFFSVSGVDLTAGYTLSGSQEVAVFRAVSARSKQVILTVDHSKFDTISFVKLDDLDLFPTVVCDGGIPASYLEQYRKNGVSLVLPGRHTQGV